MSDLSPIATPEQRAEWCKAHGLSAVWLLCTWDEIQAVQAELQQLRTTLTLTGYLEQQPEEPEDHSRHLTPESQPYYITQAEVDASHPLATDEHDVYAAALTMVGERHGKYDLVDLVHALLLKLKKAKA